MLQQLLGGLAISDLAAGQQEGDGAAVAIGQGVDLGRAPAARAADGLLALPPFPPEAERCAFTAEESMSTCAGGPPARAKRMEEIDPDALGGPSDVAVVERLVRPVVGRRIDPAPAGLQDMDDAADHPAIIDPRLATCIGRQMRLDPRELLVRQPEAILDSSRPPEEAVNHKTAARSNDFMGSDPKLPRPVLPSSRECLPTTLPHVEASPSRGDQTHPEALHHYGFGGQPFCDRRKHYTQQAPDRMPISTMKRRGHKGSSGSLGGSITTIFSGVLSDTGRRYTGLYPHVWPGSRRLACVSNRFIRCLKLANKLLILINRLPYDL